MKNPTNYIVIFILENVHVCFNDSLTCNLSNLFRQWLLLKHLWVRRLPPQVDTRQDLVDRFNEDETCRLSELTGRQSPVEVGS